MHLYTRLPLLIAIALVAKGSTVLEGISQKFEPYKDGKGISHEHETYREEKWISEQHETHREEKRIQGKRRTMDDNGDYGGGDTIITKDGGLFFNPPSTAAGRQVERKPNKEKYTAIIKTTADVSQIVIYMNFFNLTGPREGKCKKDSLEIKGIKLLNRLPKLCGFICNQTLYIDNDYREQSYEITLKTEGDPAYERTWDFKIKYVKQENANRLLRKCLHLHNDTEGTLNSFNFGGELRLFKKPSRVGCVVNSSPIGDSYMSLNNQDYHICFQLRRGYCGVEINFSTMDLGDEPCEENYIKINGKYYCQSDKLTIKETTNKKFITMHVKTGVYEGKAKAVCDGFSGTYKLLSCKFISGVSNITNTTNITNISTTRVQSTLGIPGNSSPEPSIPSFLGFLIGWFN